MLENISVNKSFAGWHKQYNHESKVLNCTMRFAIYLPPQASEQNKVPVIYWLSGLTCTDENFMQKAGALKIAAELGIAIVCPDTSPRGEGVADDDGYDLGQGAGFYVNATQAPWQKHFQMYDYVVKELPELIQGNFPVSELKSISGHSMGGHGALMIALKNPNAYQSVTAFSPITNPSNCPWGKKAFTAYLGNDSTLWQSYDSCELLKQTKTFMPALIEQGGDDQFLTEQLKPGLLEAAVAENNLDVKVSYQAGYDHSYYFIASFIEKHLRFHADYLLTA